nr:MAG: RNA-dependent RNA polymerase [Riboviria sp.]
MRQPLITQTVEWNISNVRNDILVQFDLPSIFQQLDLYHRRTLELYNFMNFTLRMDFRLNTTPFHSGRLVVMFDPMDLCKNNPLIPVQNRDLNVFRASMQPSVEMDAGMNNVASLDIPWEHYLSYINMNQSRGPMHQNGTVYVLVQNPLFVPTSAPTSVSLNILVSCKDINLEIPVRPHALQLTAPAVGTANMDLANSLTGAISDLTTGNLGGVLKKGVGALKRYVNFDKPAKLDTKVTNCLSSAAPLAHTVGIDGSVRLSTDPESSYTENHFSIAPPEEKQISNIIQTRCLFDIKTWNQSDVVNTEIAAFKVRPGLYGLNRALYNGDAIYRETPTYLSYMEKAFRLWSGGIVFKFKFASSQMHTGKLQFSFEPTLSPKVYGGETVQDYGQGPSILFDLHESKTLEFHVPYVADRPQLLTTNANTAADMNTEEQCLGILRVKVVNQLVGTGNVAPSIEMNCYIAAAPDFEFDVLAIRSGVALSNFDIAGIITQGEPNMQTDATKTRAEDTSPGFSIVKGSRSRTRRNRFKDQVEDVRDACKRFGLLTDDAVDMLPYTPWRGGSTTTSGMYAGQSGYPVGLARVVGQGYGIQSYIPLYYFSKLFVFQSGSLRYKFVPMIDRTQPILFRAIYSTMRISVAQITPSISDNNANESYPQTIQNSSQDASIEIEAPFYSMFNQHLTQTDAVLGVADINAPYYSGQVQLTALTYDVDKLPPSPLLTDRKCIPYKAYISAGNDYDLRFLISPPDIFQNVNAA